MTSSADERNIEMFDFNEFFRLSPIGMALFNADGEFEDVNDAYCNIYGYVRGDLLGREFTVLFPPDQRSALRQAHRDFLNNKTPMDGEYEVIVRDGRSLPIIARSICMTGRDGQKRRLVSVTDISEERQREQTLTRAIEANRAYLRVIPDLILTHTIDGKYLEIDCPSGRPLLAPKEEQIGRFPHDVLPEVVAEKYMAAFTAARETGELQTFHYQLELKGEPRHLEARTTLAGGDRFVSIVRDVTQTLLYQNELHQRAFHDSLTGLPNRSLLQDRLRQTLASSRRTGIYSALLFIDLDNFKSLNDTHGHDAGDLFLIEVGKRLLWCVRDQDTVARFGGDEFVILLLNLTSDLTEAHTKAKNIADKLLALVSEPYVIHASRNGTHAVLQHVCTASLGGILVGHEDDSVENRLAGADQAMFEAKRAGRNKVCFAVEDAIGASREQIQAESHRPLQK